MFWPKFEHKALRVTLNVSCFLDWDHRLWVRQVALHLGIQIVRKHLLDIAMRVWEPGNRRIRDLVRQMKFGIRQHATPPFSPFKPAGMKTPRNVKWFNREIQARCQLIACEHVPLQQTTTSRCALN